MDRKAFLAKFGGIYEHFPQIAESAWGRGLTPETDTPAGLAAVMADIAGGMHATTKMKLIRAHPDLAGKAAVAGELTAASTSEQAGAGLDQCTPEEFARFETLNRTYKQKFKFPFIIAVAGKTRHDILAAFEQRLQNDRDTEFETALAEIDKIARFRLEALAA
jgi:OHCU decarboxylase